jgi:hypothetical protein
MISNSLGRPHGHRVGRADEREQAFVLELRTTLLAAAEKRDRVGQFMAHLENQVTFADVEIRRLQGLRTFYQKTLDRMEGHVVRVIESLGLDSKGKRKKLEGNTVVFALNRCEKRVEITASSSSPRNTSG